MASASGFFQPRTNPRTPFAAGHDPGNGKSGRFQNSGNPGGLLAQNAGENKPTPRFDRSGDARGRKNVTRSWSSRTIASRRFPRAIT